MLKDGPEFLKKLIRLSPLPDSQDEFILSKLAQAVRSVVLGTLGIAIIQGLLTTIGLMIFGISQPVLWGAIAAVCALIPYFGTSFVFVGAVLDAVISHSYGAAIGLTIWGVFIVGLIDNILMPYLISIGEKSHPFAVLISVLGGVLIFGPMGFLVGPVFLTLFFALFELYSFHIIKEEKQDQT
jgi:predicted PurR-regulated permease PerM